MSDPDTAERPKGKKHRWMSRLFKTHSQPGSASETQDAEALAYPQSSADEVDGHTQTPDLKESAYAAAWRSLDDKDKAALSDHDTISQLFDQLHRANEQHGKSSKFQKGLTTADPYLTGLSKIIELASPALSLQPGAGAAAGVVTGAIKLANSVSSASSELTSHIDTFNKNIPAIDLCNEVAASRTDLPSVHAALVGIYKDLLEFHVKAYNAFQKSGKKIGSTTLAISWDKAALAGILTSFNRHIEVLKLLLGSETLASVKKIEDRQIEAWMIDKLNANRNDEEDFITLLKDREDEACSWIASNDHFIEWVSDESAKLLALVGDMGSGKTMTAAYVVDYLSTNRAVCAYFGNRDTSKASLAGVYRSLIWQLLHRQPHLQAQYADWYDKEKSSGIVDPTSSDTSLEDFLREGLSASKTWVFIVVDGLDEYSTKHQERLLRLFGQIFDSGSLLKVFVSCRHGESERRLLPGTTKIEVLVSADKDRYITTFLCCGSSDISDNIQQKVIEEISTKAKGSAIWIDLAIKYISRSKIKNQAGFQRAMGKLPSSKDLAKLYFDLFHQACQDIDDNEIILQVALETLAVSERSLTFAELSWAVFVDPASDIATVAELQELVESVDLRDLIQPFARFIKHGSGNADLDEVQLVHQSITTLIEMAPPQEWVGTKLTNDTRHTSRLDQLNAALLRRCIKYLLLDECGDKDIMAPHRDATTLVELAGLGFFDDAEDSGDDHATASQEESTTDFDPAAQGFGGFYTYAACFWTSHFSTVSSNYRPPIDDIIALCDSTPFRRQNWIEQWMRPNCTYKQERTFRVAEENANPFIVIACFGPSASLTDLLQRGLSQDSLSSLWTGAGYLIQRGEVASIRELTRSDATRAEISSIELLFSIARRLGARAVESNAKREWQGLLDAMIHDARSELVVDGNGNDLLCHAACNGCLLVVERLFAAADDDAELRSVMLAEKRAYGPVWMTLMGYPNELTDHQSVGEAVHNCHYDVVDFLCRQPGIEAHVRFRSPKDATVFHRAARIPRAYMFERLYQAWPEGLSILDDDEETPLGLLLWNHSSTRPAHGVAGVEFIVSTGVDVNGFVATSGEPRIPLLYSVSNNDIVSSRVLITQGSADPYGVLEVDGTGRPVLKYGRSLGVNSSDPAERERASARQETVKALCRLVPIAVSTEYLV